MKDIKAGVKITGKDESKGAFTSFANSINAADLKTKQFNISLSSVAKGVGIAGGLVVGAAAAIGGAAVAIGKGVFNLADSTFEYLDAISDMASITGLSITQAERLKYVFELSGSSAESATDAFRKFAKSMLDIKQPGNKTMKELRQISPEFAKIVKSAKNNDEALSGVLKSLSRMENSTKKNVLAQLLFGKTTLDVMSVVNKGAAEYDKLSASADKNSVATDAMMVNADAYEVAMLNMSQAVTGLKTALGVELMPMLTDAAISLGAFITEMRPDIIKLSRGLIKSMGEMIQNTVKIIIENPDAIKNFFGDAVDSIKAVVDEIKNVNELIQDGKTWWQDVDSFISGDTDRRDKALAKAGVPIIYGTQNAGKIVDPEMVMSGALLNSMEGTGPLGMLNPAALIGGISDAVAAGIAAQKQNLDITLRYVGGKDAWRAQVSSQGGGVTVSEAPKNYFDPGAFE